MKIQNLGPEKYRLFWELGRVQGRRHQKTEIFHGSRRAAEKHWRQVQQTLDQAGSRPAVSYTLHDLWNKWERDIVPVKDLKRSTLNRYRMQYMGYIHPHWGSVPVRDVTTEAVQQWITQLYHQGGKRGDGLSPRTIHGIYIVFMMLLDQAEVWGWIDRNPTGDRRVLLPRITRARLPIWTREQGSQFIRDARPYRHYPLWMLALTTGMRLGELLALQWSDLNWEAHRITVQRAWSAVENNVYDLDIPKTDTSQRIVPWPPDIDEILMAWRQRQAEEYQKWSHEPMFLFTGANGVVLTVNNAEHRLKKVCLRIGVPYIGFHGLRRTFASWMAESNIPLTVLRDILGHADSSTTADIYIQTSMAGQNQAINQVMGDILRPL